MKNAICIAGLPGSGKTYLAKTIAEKYRCQLSDDEGVLNSYDKNKHWVISDAYLCLSIKRDELSKLLEGFDVTWIFFENNPSACAKNMMTRGDDDGMLRYLNWLAPAYKIPNYGKVVPIYGSKDESRY